MQTHRIKVCIAATRYILYADLAHLVERHLAKVEVAGSSPVIRSKEKQPHFNGVAFLSKPLKGLREELCSER